MPGYAANSLRCAGINIFQLLTSSNIGEKHNDTKKTHQLFDSFNTTQLQQIYLL